MWVCGCGSVCVCVCPDICMYRWWRVCIQRHWYQWWCGWSWWFIHSGLLLLTWKVLAYICIFSLFCFNLMIWVEFFVFIFQKNPSILVWKWNEKLHGLDFGRYHGLSELSLAINATVMVIDLSFIKLLVMATFILYCSVFYLMKSYFLVPNSSSVFLYFFFQNYLQVIICLSWNYLLWGLSLTLSHCAWAGDALHSLRANLQDPNNVLQSWDPTLVNPCTWFHVTCNNDNSVIRV